MKLVITIFLLLLFAHAKAQSDDVLPVDESGKLIYYELVEFKTASKDLLQNRVIAFFKRNKDQLKFQKMIGDSIFLASGKMIVNKTVLVMSHPSGEIQFHFQLELKEGRYRFWLTNFNFIGYQRDRYGNFVPSTSLGIPLDEPRGKLTDAQLLSYKTQAAVLAKEFALRLKAQIASQGDLALPSPKKEIIRKTW